ncbi:sterol carrier family protein [Streptomyces sp. NPDC004959]|uniref:maleylpyruvate isomerase family mycothiol-dependent enzyme n=1 Tax=unclassified Streptomyces TaxID=2593676 RepID=UPI0033BAA1ED
MPPAKRRPRTYDFRKTSTALFAQYGLARAAVRGLGERELALPSGLGEWTVAELVTHLGLTLESVTRAIEAEPPTGPQVALTDWPFTTVSRAALNEERVRERAAGLVGRAALDDWLAETATRADRVLDGALPGRLVAAPAGPMALGDLLVTRCVELVVHSDDLARATGHEVALDRQALAACTRLLADALAARVPGASTEVRVPPYAVVQCVEGPRHTRGTPPNVVETDPLTWVRLATGRTDWASERAAARVSASGERADLSPYLPLLG